MSIEYYVQRLYKVSCDVSRPTGFPAGNPRVNIHLLWKLILKPKHAFYMLLWCRFLKVASRHK